MASYYSEYALCPESVSREVYKCTLLYRNDLYMPTEKSLCKTTWHQTNFP